MRYSRTSSVKYFCMGVYDIIVKTKIKNKDRKLHRCFRSLHTTSFQLSILKKFQNIDRKQGKYLHRSLIKIFQKTPLTQLLFTQYK